MTNAEKNLKQFLKEEEFLKNKNLSHQELLENMTNPEQFETLYLEMINKD